MIYKDGGKIMVNADGKLAYCCPPADKDVSVTFKDVIECAGAAWPSDLNTEFILPYVGDGGTYNYWAVTVDGWYVRFHCYKPGFGEHKTMLFEAQKVSDGKIAFKSNANYVNPKDNIQDVIGWCAVGAAGYEGTVFWKTA